tara:strand:+ start:1068 stop:1523 length:456 start_codon:yes stop_codon:yes gene_type:complete
MAITYTNIIKERVTDSLEAILKAEFPTIPIVYGKDLPIRGSQWFRLIPVSDVAEALAIDGETRRYAVQIRYLLMIGGRDAKNTHFTRLSSMGEHIKRLMANNRNYSPSGTYKYHDLACTSVIYGADLLEDEDVGDLSAVSWEIEVSVGESF